MNKIKELWSKATTFLDYYRNWVLVFTIGVLFGACMLALIMYIV